MLSFFVHFSNFTLCHFSFPIAFQLSQLTAKTGGEFKSMNSSSIVYPYLATPIGKPFSVSITLFCSLPIKSYHHNFFKLSLATTMMLLKPVSCDHMTPFNYDDKKARDVGLTYWCHMSNVMSDSIFCESMRLGITCSFFVCGLILVFLRIKEMESVITITSVDMEKS